MTRYRLHAFVCDGACVETSNHIGWMTLDQVWLERKQGCRYAVVETADGMYQVWDSHDDDHLAVMSGQSDTMPPMQSFTDPDAAVVATLMRYEKGMRSDYLRSAISRYLRQS